MKSKKKKPVSVRWARWTCSSANLYAIWIGRVIVKFEERESLAALSVEAANAELSRLVVNRDRRLRRKGGGS